MGAVQGTSEGIARFIARPIIGGAVLVERVASGFTDGVTQQSDSHDNQLNDSRTNASKSFHNTSLVTETESVRLFHSASSKALSPEDVAIDNVRQCHPFCSSL